MLIIQPLSFFSFNIYCDHIFLVFVCVSVDIFFIFANKSRVDGKLIMRMKIKLKREIDLQLNFGNDV